MTDIEQARTILTKWGEGATPGPWTLDSEGDLVDAKGSEVVQLASLENASYAYLSDADATLIAAMTDPALREALDGLLYDAGEISAVGLHSAGVTYAERIAAAIIAIDQRMNA